MKKNLKKISFDPISAFVWLWLLVVNGFVVAINYLFAIAIHELGHFLVAKKCGYSVSRFAISPYGVELAYFNQNLDYKDEFYISVAGPLFNIISAFMILGLWWIFPTTYAVSSSFVFVSFVLAFFNMLPAYPLDGGRMFVCFASHFMKGKTAKKITLSLNIILSVIFFGFFVVFLFFNFNPTFLLFSIFLFCGVLDLWKSTKYEKVNVFTKASKPFSKPIFRLVCLEQTIGEVFEKIEPTKTCIFTLVLENGKIVNLSEKLIINLVLNFDKNTKLKNIIKK